MPRLRVDLYRLQQQYRHCTIGRNVTRTEAAVQVTSMEKREPIKCGAEPHVRLATTARSIYLRPCPVTGMEWALMSQGRIRCPKDFKPDSGRR